MPRTGLHLSKNRCCYKTCQGVCFSWIPFNPCWSSTARILTSVLPVKITAYIVSDIVSKMQVCEFLLSKRLEFLSFCKPVCKLVFQETVKFHQAFVGKQVVELYCLSSNKIKMKSFPTSLPTIRLFSHFDFSNAHLM